MKQLFILAVSIAIITGCNNANKNAAAGSAVNDSTGRRQINSANEEKISALQQLTPYTTDQMKALLPATLNGDSASGQSAYMNMGTGYAQANYIHDDSTRIQLSIFDCGGNAGAGLYTTQYLALLSGYDQSSTRLTDFRGEKAVEHGDNNRSAFTFFGAGRLLVSMDAVNVSLQTLKELAAGLTLNP